jgi:hypothetical protein
LWVLELTDVDERQQHRACCPVLSAGPHMSSWQRNIRT